MWGGNNNQSGPSKFTYTKKVFTTTPNTTMSTTNNTTNNTTTTTNTTDNTEPSTDSNISPKLFTVGYGGCKTFAEFLAILRKSDISLLVDIRIRPNCGYCKDFNGPKLDELLSQNHIKYEHFSELGNIFKDVEDSGKLYPEK
jgi:hypothetical protein